MIKNLFYHLFCNLFLYQTNHLQDHPEKATVQIARPGEIRKMCSSLSSMFGARQTDVRLTGIPVKSSINLSELGAICAARHLPVELEISRRRAIWSASKSGN